MSDEGLKWERTATSPDPVVVRLQAEVAELKRRLSAEQVSHQNTATQLNKWRFELMQERDAARAEVERLEAELSTITGQLQESREQLGDWNVRYAAACKQIVEARRERDALQAAVDQLKGTDVHHLKGCVNVLASKLAYYTGKTVPTEITGAESVVEDNDRLRGLLREAVEAPRFDEIPESWFERSITALESQP